MAVVASAGVRGDTRGLYLKTLIPYGRVVSTNCDLGVSKRTKLLSAIPLPSLDSAGCWRRTANPFLLITISSCFRPSSAMKWEGLLHYQVVQVWTRGESEALPPPTFDRQGEIEKLIDLLVPVLSIHFRMKAIVVSSACTKGSSALHLVRASYAPSNIAIYPFPSAWSASDNLDNILHELLLPSYVSRRGI